MCVISSCFILLQVNGKSYNQARLLLGNMGSLHPANRLAAYVTGRLNAPPNLFYKKAPKSDSANKVNTPGPLYIKAAGTVVPPIITARKTTELKTPAQPPGNTIALTPAHARRRKLIGPQRREMAINSRHTCSYCRRLTSSNSIKVTLILSGSCWLKINNVTLCHILG